MTRQWIRLGAALALLLSCRYAMAQDPREKAGVVDGHGQVALRPSAKALRVQIILHEEGDDMAAVLKTLEQHGDKFRNALLAAQADKGSIKLDGPKLLSPLRATGPLEPIQQSWWKGGKAKQQMPVQQMPPPNGPPQPGPPNAAPGAPASPPEAQFRRLPRIILQTQLTAEWPLNAKTQPELLIEADEIVLKAHESLKGLLPKEEPPDGRRRQSSKAQGDEPFDDEDENSPNHVFGPNYTFVGRVDGKQLRKAWAEAFQKAEANAAEVAQVGGRRIGDLATLSVSSPGGGEEEFNPFGPGISPPGGMGPRLRGAENAAGDHAEVTAGDPSGLQIIVQVSTTFRLLPP
jgi:hypothetical protein